MSVITKNKMNLKQGAIRKTIVNIISLSFLVFIFYKFILGLTLNDLLVIVISGVISYLLSSFVFNSFKYSDNIIIRFLQKILLYSIYLFIISCTLTWLDFLLHGPALCHGPGDDGVASAPSEGTHPVNNNNITDNTTASRQTDDFIVKKDVNKEGDTVFNVRVKESTVKKGIENVFELGKILAENVAPNIGIGAAAGTAAGAAVKASAGMAPVPRIAFIGGTAAVTAAGTSLGMAAGQALSEHSGITESIKNSRHGSTDPNRIPTPEPNVINSPLEFNENLTPLDVLLTSLFGFNMLELILLMMLLLIIFHRYIVKINFKFITKLVNNYMPNKFINWYNKKIQQSEKVNDTFITVMLIFIGILLILFKLVNIYISAELCVNTAEHVEVYNHLKGISKSSILLLLTLSTKVSMKNSPSHRK